MGPLQSSRRAPIRNFSLRRTRRFFVGNAPLVVDRIRAKVTRAKQHIRDFQLGLSAFKATDPYQFAMKEDAQRGKRIFYVSKADPVPDSLTAIAADVIQNLRARSITSRISL